MHLFSVISELFLSSSHILEEQLYRGRRELYKCESVSIQKELKCYYISEDNYNESLASSQHHFSAEELKH
jgi:hypothetical protein